MSRATATATARPTRVFYVDQPVKCVECGRTTKRRSLRQIYCGERCSLKARQRAYRDRKALKKNAPEFALSGSDVVSARVIPEALRIHPLDSGAKCNGLKQI
jgi:ribosomal protein L37AE/L43A